jgi:hypothetical protein
MTESAVGKRFGVIDERFGAIDDHQQRAMSGLEFESSFLCPITGYPCEGDLSHLCEEYGCARKGGLSPHSDENL